MGLDAVKRTLFSTPVLKKFDLSLENAFHTDASKRNGLGYALLQEHAKGRRLVQAGSRFATDAESNYEMVELEMKGVEWAVKKCRLYLLGLQHFTVVVDHQALVPILNKFTLDAVENPRLQRLKEKLSPYSIETVKEKTMRSPDALSRAPVADPMPEDIEDENELTSQVRSAIRICAIEIQDIDEDAK